MNISFEIPASARALTHVPRQKLSILKSFIIALHTQTHYVTINTIRHFLVQRFAHFTALFLLMSYPVIMLDNPGVSRRIYTNEPPLHLE